MSALFSPLVLRGITLLNRIVVSPMAQYSANEGRATNWHLVHLGHLCFSGAGLLMTEATAVEAIGRSSLCCLGLYDDPQERAIKDVVDFCRQFGSARLGMQLTHSGRKGSIRPAWAGRGALPLEEGGWQTVAPSPIAVDPNTPAPAPLDLAGMARIREAFRSSALRAMRAGFDLVELHAAHGYLLHEFLSPLTNHRSDAYGGDAARRMRFPLEVAETVRSAIPADRAMGVRISASDWVEGGFELDDAIAFAGALKDVGCDYVCVTSGGLVASQRIKVAPGYQVPFAAAVRKHTGIVTRVVGLITHAKQADAIVQSGDADLIALARAVLDNPRWGWHAAEALGATVPIPAAYKLCVPAVWPGARLVRPGSVAV